MARRTFFSFHYQRDIWRVNQIRNLPEVDPQAAAGFKDASIWEEARAKGEAAIKKLIDGGLLLTTVTVVFIGSKTSGRKYINYEIDKSIERGNGILGVRVHHLKDQNGIVDSEGDVPYKLTANGCPIYRYTNSTDLVRWIEKAAKDAGK